MSAKLTTLADVTVTTAGTRVQGNGGTALWASKIIIQAAKGNTGLSYFGDSSVASGRGISLDPGERYELSGMNNRGSGQEQLNVADLWFDAATNGNKFKIAYINAQ